MKIAPANMAKASTFAMPVSYKHVLEISHMIKGKEVAKAAKMLEEVVALKRPVPFRKYNHGGVGQKRGIGTGRYPEKAAGQVLRLLLSVEANAKNKGLSTEGLIIHRICPQKAPKAWHYGRQSRRRMKRSDLQIVLIEKSKDAKASEKTAAKAKAKEKSKTGEGKK